MPLARSQIRNRAVRTVSDGLSRAAQILRGEGIDNHSLNGERRFLRSIGAVLPPDAVLFDVGANVGRWTLEAASLLPTARIHAFEPQPSAFGDLSRHAASHKNVSCHELALGATPGRSLLHFDPTVTPLSSLHTRDLESLDVALDSKVEVGVTTLDDFCDQHRIDHVDFVKIDVEGHELDVLRGAASRLADARIQAVQFEYGGTYLDAGIRLRDVVRCFPDLYSVYRLVPWGVMSVEEADLRQETFRLSNYAALHRDLERLL